MRIIAIWTSTYSCRPRSLTSWPTRRAARWEQRSLWTKKRSKSFLFSGVSFINFFGAAFRFLTFSPSLSARSEFDEGRRKLYDLLERVEGCSHVTDVPTRYVCHKLCQLTNCEAFFLLPGTPAGFSSTTATWWRWTSPRTRRSTGSTATS